MQTRDPSQPGVTTFPGIIVDEAKDVDRPHSANLLARQSGA
jgi:hypothetical protein